MQPYFGTSEELPKTHILQAGKLNCLYEQGALRYICLGEFEVIRMIYFALRDENWLTILPTISSENIIHHSDHFKISYTLNYRTDKINYDVDCLLEGKSDNSICFLIQGKSLGEFKRNRIGLCIHHPIKEHLAKPIQILQINGETIHASFPELISPHQLFKNIKAMQWKLQEGTEVDLNFRGDNFETEDQRNWTDCSFKTYGTPLDLPFPVVVKKGEQVHQQVALKLLVPEHNNIEVNEHQSNELFAIKGKKHKFPKIGYSRSTEVELSIAEFNALENIPFDHYRIEIRFEKFWKRSFLNAIADALSLNTSLELVVFFKNHVEIELTGLIEVIKENKILINSVLVLHQQYKVTPLSLVENVIHIIKTHFPQIQIGYGTDANFAELNRNPPTGGGENIDFISYSVNPQVHSSDFRSLIENVEGLKYSINTGKAIAPGKAIYISPLTLMPRYNPNATSRIQKKFDLLNSNTDYRQHTEFAAAWMLMSLRYLAGSEQITLFETIGKKGVINKGISASSTQNFIDDNERFPIYKYLKKIYNFKPVGILDSQFPNPLIVDGIILENADGDQVSYIVNFEQGFIKELFKSKEDIR